MDLRVLEIGKDCLEGFPGVVVPCTARVRAIADEKQEGTEAVGGAEC